PQSCTQFVIEGPARTRCQVCGGLIWRRLAVDKKTNTCSQPSPGGINQLSGRCLRRGGVLQQKAGTFAAHRGARRQKIGQRTCKIHREGIARGERRALSPRRSCYCLAQCCARAPCRTCRFQSELLQAELDGLAHAVFLRSLRRTRPPTPPGFTAIGGTAIVVATGFLIECTAKALQLEYKRRTLRPQAIGVRVVLPLPRAAVASLTSLGVSHG